MWKKVYIQTFLAISCRMARCLLTAKSLLRDLAREGDYFQAQKFKNTMSNRSENVEQFTAL